MIMNRVVMTNGMKFNYMDGQSSEDLAKLCAGVPEIEWELNTCRFIRNESPLFRTMDIFYSLERDTYFYE